MSTLLLALLLNFAFPKLAMADEAPNLGAPSALEDGRAEGTYCERISFAQRIQGTCTQVTQAALPGFRPLRQIMERQQEVQALEMVRRRHVQLTDASRLEANLIEFCYDDGREVAAYQKFLEDSRLNPPRNQEELDADRRQQNQFIEIAATAADSPVLSELRKLCPDQRTATQSQVENVRKFRRALALSEPAFADARERLSFGARQKLNPNLTMVLNRFSWNRIPGISQEHQPLDAQEVSEAEAEYDAKWREIAQRRFGIVPTEADLFARRFPHPEFDSIMRAEITAWRQTKRQEAMQILEHNQFVRHFTSGSVNDRAVVLAAQRARRLSNSYQDRLRAMGPQVGNSLADWSPGRSVMDLMMLDDPVMDVVRAQPELCGAADRLAARWRQVSAIKDGALLGGTLGGILVCYAVTRSPLSCSTWIGTGASAYLFADTRSRYHFQLDAYEAAISEDSSIMPYLEQLSDADRQTLFTFLFVPMPNELLLGGGFVLLEKIPAFRNLADRLAVNIRMGFTGRHASRKEAMERLLHFRETVERNRKALEAARSAADRAIAAEQIRRINAAHEAARRMQGGGVIAPYRAQ